MEMVNTAVECHDFSFVEAKGASPYLLTFPIFCISRLYLFFFLWGR